MWNCLSTSFHPMSLLLWFMSWIQLVLIQQFSVIRMDIFSFQNVPLECNPNCNFLSTWKFLRLLKSDPSILLTQWEERGGLTLSHFLHFPIPLLCTHWGAMSSSKIREVLLVHGFNMVSECYMWQMFKCWLSYGRVY